MGAAAKLLSPPQRLRRLQIEVTTHCNLLCEECSRTVGLAAGTWIDKHMSFDDFCRIIDNSPPADVLVLQGVGEPSLNPSLIEMTRHAHGLGRFGRITLNTNAVTRSLDYFRELRAAGLAYVCISVDSLNPKIAELCRFGTKVDKLTKRIRAIYAEYNSVVISMVASRLNFFDIPQTLAELNQIGEDISPTRQFVVEIVPVINYHDKTSNAPDNSLSAEEVVRLNDVINLFKPQLPRLIPKLNSGMLPDPTSAAMCARPFFSPYVTVDGFLTPCCTTFDPAIFGHTNIIYMSMRDAWTSAPVRDWLRHYLIERDPICQGCPFNFG